MKEMKIGKAPMEVMPSQGHGQLYHLKWNISNLYAIIPVNLNMGGELATHVQVTVVHYPALPSEWTAAPLATRQGFSVHWDQEGHVTPMFTAGTPVNTGKGVFTGNQVTDTFITAPVTNYIMNNPGFLWDFELKRPTDEINLYLTYNASQKITLNPANPSDLVWSFNLFLWVHN
jgi:hypothetical protein